MSATKLLKIFKTFGFILRRLFMIILACFSLIYACYASYLHCAFICNFRKNYLAEFLINI